MNVALVYLIASAISESVWNIFLTRSKGWLDWTNNLSGIAALVLGIVLFKKALATFPLGVSVVIWSGLALLSTILLDMMVLGTKVNGRTLLLMALAVLSILALSYSAHKPG